MAELFRRVCTVLVAQPERTGDQGVRLEGMRFQFQVVRTLAKEPNTCDLKVTNLAPSTRSLLQGRGCRVVISAGYEDDAAVLFTGDARTVDHRREGTDWVSHFACGDGERAYRLARASRSFAAGTPLATVVREAANALGVGSGNLERALAPLAGRTLAHGYAMHGQASGQLDVLLRSLGLAWSVQDGALQVLSARESLPGTAVLLEPESGLVGTPEAGSPDAKGAPPVAKVKSLLQPRIRPGSRVDLRSAGLRGLFRAQRVEHAGDTAGGDWYSSLDLVPA